VDCKVHEVPEPRRPYASASHTPSSHCGSGAKPASSERDVGVAPRTQGELGHKGCRRAQSFWDMDVPKCITSTATLLLLGSAVHVRQIEAGYQVVAVAVALEGDRGGLAGQVVEAEIGVAIATVLVTKLPFGHPS
jgi:hypothetical protein